MLSKINIKSRLFLLLFSVVSGILILIFLMNRLIIDTQHYGYIEVDTERLNTSVKSLSFSGSNFFFTKKLIHKDNFEKTYKIFIKEIKELEKDLTKYNLGTEDIVKYQKLIKTYKLVFIKMVEKQNEIGLTYSTGLHGVLRKSVHKLQDQAKQSNDYKLLSAVYNLRKHEKDFMIRGNTKYSDKFIKNIDLLANNENLDSNIKESVLIYKNNFLKIIKVKKELGLNSNTGLRAEMKNISKSCLIASHKLLDKVKKNIDKDISYRMKFDFMIAFLLIVILLVLILTVIKSITSAISNFETGLEGFFKYLNKEITSIV
ncbi:MAG: hypothetical protein DRG78_18430, partial [Epsilonproteobacteria bacterium]